MLGYQIFSCGLAVGIYDSFGGQGDGMSDSSGGLVVWMSDSSGGLGVGIFFNC